MMTKASDVTVPSEESPMVLLWLRWSWKHVLFGVFAGKVAGIASLAVAMMFAAQGDKPLLYPLSLMGTIVGGSAMLAYDAPLYYPIMGGVIYLCIGGFWGGVFGHFVSSARCIHHYLMGLVWGLFSWVFTWNLFLQSFYDISYQHVPSGIGLAVSLVYGLSLGFINAWIPPKRL